MFLGVLGCLAAAATASSVVSGGPGYAMFNDEVRGFYMPHFSLPATEITFETWSKASPVRPVYFVRNPR
jgi:hypothetical protein